MADKEDTLIITDDEGAEHEFIVVDILEVEENEYAILLPVEMDDTGAEAIVLKIGKDEKGKDILLEIDDEEEFRKVAEAWEIAVGDEEDS